MCGATVWQKSQKSQKSVVQTELGMELEAPSLEHAPWWFLGRDELPHFRCHLPVKVTRVRVAPRYLPTLRDLLYQWKLNCQPSTCFWFSFGHSQSHGRRGRSF